MHTYILRCRKLAKIILILRIVIIRISIKSALVIYGFKNSLFFLFFVCCESSRTSHHKSYSMHIYFFLLCYLLMCINNDKEELNYHMDITFSFLVLLQLVRDAEESYFVMFWAELLDGDGLLWV